MSEKATQYLLRFYLSRMEDKVIWDYLQTRTNKTDYIKDLILKDITHERSLEKRLKGVLEEFFGQNPDININVKEKTTEVALSLPEEKIDIFEEKNTDNNENNTAYIGISPEDVQDIEEPEELSPEVKDFLASMSI